VATPISPDEDRAAIVRTVLDYFEGWFDGDAVRMERALHPDLAKRSLGGDQRWWAEHGRAGRDPEPLDSDTAQSMIEATARGVGRTRARTEADRRIDIEVEDVYDTMASVTVRGRIYHEYLQLARTRVGWKIVNALWQRTSESSERR
jgi:putative lumazine-binding protein